MVQIMGRIYKIVSRECDGCYIGSTTQQLSRRLSVHKCHYRAYLAGKSNYVASFEVLKFADASIELIHEGVFDSKIDLEHLEGEIIQTTPNALNKRIAGWTGTKQEYERRYYQNNRDAILSRRSSKCVCPTCGGTYTHGNKTNHHRTQKHQNAVSSAISVTDSSEASSDFS